MATEWTQRLCLALTVLALSACGGGSDGKDGKDGHDGAEGAPALVSTQSEPAGSNCPEGGWRILSGTDTNRDSILSEAEIQSTRYLCHGTSGSDGSDGGNGQDGQDGLYALVRTSSEPSGDNCAAGGVRIDSGLDQNANGVLENHEIQATSYVCNGLDSQDEEDNPPPPSTNARPLNDTGTILCSNYIYANDGDTNMRKGDLDCAATGATATTTGVDSDGYPVPAGQDAHFGRDAKAMAGSLIKTGNGHAGFDFTKLDSNGDVLAQQEAAYGSAQDQAIWDCVRDNVTGLVWEVKTTDGGLHHTGNTYSWYNSDTSNNGGSAGIANGGSCLGVTGCDTQKLVQEVNAAGLCGKHNWRLPTSEELLSIVNYDGPRLGFVGVFDPDYFPNIPGPIGNTIPFWTASPYASDSNRAWIVTASGSVFSHTIRDSSYTDISGIKENAYYVRLVRDSDPQ